MRQGQDIRCTRWIVAGRVQGVFYRASTQAQALRLGLTGYARNLPDGRVEVMACGPAKGLDVLESWLAQGPPLAEVDEVVAFAEDYREFTGFETA